jgi:hypothetical protein
MLLIENMDRRKVIGRTARELQELFRRLLKAGLCFEIGHDGRSDIRKEINHAHRALGPGLLPLAG